MNIAAICLRARDFFFLSCLLSLSQVHAADFCADVMPAAIQSHSQDGYILMEYMTRVYGSGSTLVAHDVRHTHSWQDQVGLCDGVKCQASGTHTVKSTVSFLTGTEVPAIFERGNASAGNRSNEGYRQPTLSLPANDYGTITVGQESTIRFTTADAVYKTRAIKTSYKGTLELSPGDYWIDGNLDLTAQDSVVRLINSTSTTQKVRLFVSGNITAGQIHLQGFAQGQIALYVWGNASFGNDFILPGEIHALGTVGFGMRARVSGGIYSNNFSTGNEAVIRYSRTNRDHYMGTLQPAFNSIFELSPGNYWINGNFVVDVSAIIRKINGPGKVRIFVNGNINLQHASSFEGFAAGELLLYATGNINISSQKDLPAFLYANGDVKISFSGNSKFLGNIVGHNVTIGQGSIVEYQIPNDLEPFCSTDPVINTVNYHLIYPPEALTCNDIPITVEARDNNGNLLPSAATVNLTPANMWIGTNNLNFTGNATAYLKRLPGTYTLGITNPSPAMQNLICSTPGCSITLHDSGFILNVPNMVAGIPASTASIQAVRTDISTQQCVPGFGGGSKSILLSSTYNNPGNGTLIPAINNQAVGSTPQAVTLMFDHTATAPLTIQYDDVGKLNLSASYYGTGAEDGLEMHGKTDFITRPHTLTVLRSFDGTKGNPGTTNSGTGFVAAGEPFSVIIESRSRQGAATPNFGKESPREIVSTAFSKRVYPATGSDGILAAGATNTSIAANNGQQQIDGISWNEAGSINVKAGAINYMGTGDAIERPESATIGRFYPHHFYLDNSEVKNSCYNFSYMSQPAITLNYILHARGLATNTLHNYHSNWYSGVAVPEIVSYVNNQHLPSTPNRWEITNGSWTNGIYRIAQSDARFNRATPAIPDGPYDVLFNTSLQPGLKIAYELDNRNFQSFNLGADAIRLSGTLNMRYGRAILKNAYGPENENLPIELNTEYWNGSRFVLNTDDNCTLLNSNKVIEPGTVTKTELPLKDEEDNTTGTIVQAAGATSSVQAGNSIRSNGSISLYLPAPGARGQGEMEYQLDDHPWLKYNWTGNAANYDENPVAEFIFGHYRGNPRQIYWREKF